MSLRVKKGQKITAQHNNQIADTICSLNKDIKLFGSKLEDTYSTDTMQIPVFSLCWIQANSEQLAVYWNTQDNKDNIVYYNNEPAKYIPFEEHPVNNADFRIPGEIDGPGVPNVHYELLGGFPIKGKSSCGENASGDGENKEVEGIQLTLFVDKEVLSAAYTFDCQTYIDKCKYNIITTVPIGFPTESGYGYKQVHEGLLLIDDNIPPTDTSIEELQLSSVDIRYWKNPCTEEEEPYLTLFDSDKAFSDPLQRMKKELKGVEQKEKLKTLLFIDTDGSPNDAETEESLDGTPETYGETENYDNENNNQENTSDSGCTEKVPGIKLAYGNAEEYYILNDLCGVEQFTFVTPRNIATYCDITIGANNDPSYKSTIYFENPLKKQVTYEQDSCGNTIISGALENAEYVLTIPAENIDDCGNIIPPDPNDPNSGKSVQSIFKQYIPYTICTKHEEEDYLDISIDKREYLIIGPNMEFERFNPCAKTPEEGEEGEVTQTEGFTYNKELNIWCLSLTEHLSSGCYIQLNDWKIDGPEMTLEFIDPCAESPQTAGFAYIPENHAWNLTLPQPIDSGCYIQLNDWKIDGPEMVIGKVGNDTVSQFCYDETSHKWTLDIQTTPLSAGCFIEIENNEINGPNMVLKKIDVCAENQSNRIEYNKQNHEWELYITQTNAEAGCYIQIENGKINGPDIEVTTGCELKAEYNPHKWTITVPKNASELSAGQYITIENNGINGAKIEIDNSCGKIPGTANYSNGIWTLSFDKTDSDDDITIEAGCGIDVNVDGNTYTITNTAIQEAIDIQGVCGEISVQKNGNTYTIGLDGEHENVIYDFDPEWFTVENNYVTINESAIQNVADSICVTTEVNANFAMTLARTNNPGRGGWGYVDADITGVTYDVDADTVNANSTVSWNLDEANPNQQCNTTDYPFGWE